MRVSDSEIYGAEHRRITQASGQVFTWAERIGRALLTVGLCSFVSGMLALALLGSAGWFQ